jgi:CheY-like chemotaxis protein
LIHKAVHTKTILIADSSGANIRLLGKRLRLEGFNVLVSTGGRQTLAIAQSKHPDVILVDATIKEPDGFEVCRLLREQSIFSDTRILVMAELADLSEIEKAYGAGADNFISIPYQPDEFVVRIHHLLKQKKQFPVSATSQEANLEKSILLVEDNELNQNYVSAIIHDLGYAIDVADNGETAQSLIFTKKYDLILTDINVPLINGLELTKIIREKYSQDLPVIGISGHSEKEITDKCITAGMNAFLTKPFAAKELKELITQLFSVTGDHHLQGSFTAFNPVDKGAKKYNYSQVLEMANGDNELFKKWFERFKEILRNASVNVNEAIERKEFPERNRVFHELINYSGYFGLDELRSYILEFNSVRQFSNDKERLGNFYRKIRNELENILDYYNGVV